MIGLFYRVGTCQFCTGNGKGAALHYSISCQPSYVSTQYSVGQQNMVKGCVIKTWTHATFDYIFGQQPQSLHYDARLKLH